jgi:DNA-binding NarL/FixJ family response regulator
VADCAEEVASAFAGFADLKSAYTVGHSEQVARLAVLAAEASGLSAPEVMASCAHERLDTSGYRRGLVPPRSARILAAADVMAALLEERPHRPKRTLSQAKDELGREVAGGHLEAQAVDAVIAAATGARASAPLRPGPVTRRLSERELEVLRLVARGKTNKEIGQLLGISPRTVQNHIASTYDKIGVYSRAGATLFATENWLLD